MGQIVGGAAKPKRCNLNKLSQLGTPAAGQYILVSSDNSMQSDGQGNFDCYIKGDGSTTAANLTLHKINELYDDVNRLIEKVGGYILLDDYPLEKSFLSTNWIVGSANYVGRFIPITSEMYSVTIVAASSGTGIGFVTAKPTTNGETPKYANNSRATILAANSTTTLKIPSDAVYLWITGMRGSSPQSVYVSSVADRVATNQEAIGNNISTEWINGTITSAGVPQGSSTRLRPSAFLDCNYYIRLKDGYYINGVAEYSSNSKDDFIGNLASYAALTEFRYTGGKSTLLNIMKGTDGTSTISPTEDFLDTFCSPDSMLDRIAQLETSIEDISSDDSLSNRVHENPSLAYDVLPSSAWTSGKWFRKSNLASESSGSYTQFSCTELIDITHYEMFCAINTATIDSDRTGVCLFGDGEAISVYSSNLIVYDMEELKSTYKKIEVAFNTNTETYPYGTIIKFYKTRNAVNHYQNTFTGNILGVGHRGYTAEAPENTLYSFIAAAVKGFEWVETDIWFTSDGIPVLCHEPTINSVARNSDGSEISDTITIADTTYSDLLTYDFGIRLGSQWSCQIPTLSEALETIKKLGLKVQLELKSETWSQINEIVALVKSYGMQDNVSYIASNAIWLHYVMNADPSANLFFLAPLSDDVWNISGYNFLLSGTNSVIYGFVYSLITSSNIAAVKGAGVPIHVYTIDDESTIANMDGSYIGVTSNYLIAQEVTKQSLVDTLPQ